MGTCPRTARTVRRALPEELRGWQGDKLNVPAGMDRGSSATARAASVHPHPLLPSLPDDTHDASVVLDRDKRVVRGQMEKAVRSKARPTIPIPIPEPYQTEPLGGASDAVRAPCGRRANSWPNIWCGRNCGRVPPDREFGQLLNVQ